MVLFNLLQFYSFFFFFVSWMFRTLKKLQYTHKPENIYISVVLHTIDLFNMNEPTNTTFICSFYVLNNILHS